MATVIIETPTHIKKSHSVGIIAETLYKMDAPDRYLQVSTMKSSRGFPFTSFQSVKIVGNSLSYVIFQDYNSRSTPYTEVKRCTEKSILECHNKSLLNIETELEAANKHYAKELEPTEG